MRDNLKIRLLKNICGDLIEDFLVENELIYSTEKEFTIDLSDYSLMLIPYIVNRLEEGEYAVELLLLNFNSIHEYVEIIINFLSVSNFQITHHYTRQIANVILSKSYIF